MIRGISAIKINALGRLLLLARSFLLVILVSQAAGANPPKQLTNVINHFMNMEATSIEIQQTIDWRFSSNNDTINFKMNIKAGRNFHISMASFGMEIYVSENEMMTINHLRQQVLYEDASPDALLKQLFVGGDLNDARFKKETKVETDLRQLDFKFSGDFSDWQSLTVFVDASDDLKKLNLIDYDGNKYLINLKYLENYDNFNMPDIKQEYLHYQIADLRSL